MGWSSPTIRTSCGCARARVPGADDDRTTPPLQAFTSPGRALSFHVRRPADYPVAVDTRALKIASIFLPQIFLPETSLRFEPQRASISLGSLYAFVAIPEFCNRLSDFGFSGALWFWPCQLRISDFRLRRPAFKLPGSTPFSASPSHLNPRRPRCSPVRTVHFSLPFTSRRPLQAPTTSFSFGALTTCQIGQQAIKPAPSRITLHPSRFTHTTRHAPRFIPPAPP